MSKAVGAVLGIAIALLLAIVPGSSTPASRLQSAFSATTVDQCLPLTAERAGEARRTLQKAKGPGARRADFDDGGVLPAAIALPVCIQPVAETPRLALAQGQQPGRWPATTRARAPPLA